MIQNWQPVFERGEEFLIVGVEKYTGPGFHVLQDVWTEFYARKGEIKHKSKPPIVHCYEDYSRDFEENPGGFPKYYFLAGIQVDQLADIPDGMTGRRVPAGFFAKFTHNGEMSELAECFRYIYSEWLPQSKYKLDPVIAADYERYPAPVTDPAPGIVEIFIPVVEK